MMKIVNGSRYAYQVHGYKKNFLIENNAMRKFYLQLVSISVINYIKLERGKSI